MKPENDVSFEEGDVQILNEVLDIVPELKICALAVKLRQQKQIPYPIRNHDDVFSLFEGEQIAVANHRINRKVIERYVHPTVFPISDDEALTRAVYHALTACNTEMSWALQAPPYADELLAEARRAVSSFTSKGG